MDEALVHSVESVLQSRSEREELFKQLLQPVAAQSRELANPLLREFTGVLTRGLGTLYGVQELISCETLSKADEVRLLETHVEERVGKLQEELARRADGLKAFGPVPSAALAEMQRLACMLHTVLTVARLLGLSSQTTGALQNAVERFSPFCTKSKRLSLKRFVPKSSGAPHAHQFLLMQFATPLRSVYPHCTLCGLSLWTVGVQGLQCTVCDVTVHYECVRYVADSWPCNKNAPALPSPSSTPSPVTALPAAGLLAPLATLKDAKRPRTMMSVLPNLLRKNLNLPGGATIGKFHALR